MKENIHTHITQSGVGWKRDKSASKSGIIEVRNRTGVPDAVQMSASSKSF